MSDPKFFWGIWFLYGLLTNAFSLAKNGETIGNLVVMMCVGAVGWLWCRLANR